jgi:hypothetical protein
MLNILTGIILSAMSDAEKVAAEDIPEPIDEKLTVLSGKYFEFSKKMGKANFGKRIQNIQQKMIEKKLINDVPIKKMQSIEEPKEKVSSVIEPKVHKKNIFERWFSSRVYLYVSFAFTIYQCLLVLAINSIRIFELISSC